VEKLDRKTSAENQTDTATNNNIAIIGVNRIGQTLYRQAKRFLNSHQKIVGFIKEYPLDEYDDQSSFPNILGEMDNLEDIVKRNNISQLIIAIHPQDVHIIHSAIQYCEKVKTDYYLTSSAYDIAPGNAMKELFKRLANLPKINIRYIIDFLMSLFSFLLLLPSWILIALIIKLDSRGPVLYSQERVGEDGRIFKLLKFRSFYLTRNNGEPSLESVGSYPSLSAFGRILKRYRLEDLPQLLNIILGDLSIIGPRPDEPYFHQKYSREIPFYENRLKLRPGLISLAHIETIGDNLIEDVREKLKYDLYYVDHHKSLFLNLKILIKSNLLVFNSKFN